MRFFVTGISVALTLIISTVARAEDCSSVLALSRVSNMTIESSESLVAQAANFCKEYQSGNTNTRSARFGASYKFLSGSFSSGSATESQVASRYCSSSDYSQAASNSFQKYIDSIAPGAFEAYQQCIKNNDISFYVDQSSVLDTQFAMIASWKKPGPGQAILIASPSEGVDCAWDDGTLKSIKIESPRYATLNCRRKSAAKKAFVAVTEQGGAGKLTIPWAAYTSDGFQADLVQNLRDEITSLSQQVVALKLVTDNTVAVTEVVKANLASIGVPRGGSEVVLRHDSSGSCPSGTFVSGVSNPGAHGPKNGAPYALVQFSIVCSQVR